MRRDNVKTTHLQVSEWQNVTESNVRVMEFVLLMYKYFAVW